MTPPGQDRETQRLTLATLVGDWLRWRNGTAITAMRGLREKATSYGELSHLSRRFAADLVERGINQGERVLIWGQNSAEWVAAFFGCVLRGVLPVPLDFSGSVDFAQRILNDVQPSLILCDRSRRLAFETTVDLLVLEDLEASITNEIAGAVEGLKPDDPLQIIFTSGTTGEPKGIVHTHGNVLASLGPIEREMKKYLRYERPFHPLRFLHTLPLSHVFGQFMGLWIPPLLGAEVHFEERLVGQNLVRRIKDEHISVLIAVPRILDLLKNHLLENVAALPSRLEAAQKIQIWKRWWKFRDIHRALGLKFWALICGGASLSAETEEFWRMLGFVVVQGYGMTETTALVSLNHPFRAARGTIGQVLPGREVKLGDDGEVLVRGETIASTVWQNGAARSTDSEWLATGDLADMDAEGNLRFRGRKKDVIVTAAGLNIHPEDLERALLRQPGVRQSAVVEGLTDGGPQPVAVLILEDHSEPSQIVSGANRELAPFQHMQRWMIWPQRDFPRTSTGKVLKREIRQQITIQHETASAEQLNLDSLGRVQLQARLEQQYGLAIDDAIVQKIQTRDDLHALSQSRPAQETRAVHRYPTWPWNPVQQWIRTAFLEFIAMPLVRLLGSPRVLVETSSWPTEPALIVCNHITSYDAAFILFSLPRKLRTRTAIAMSGEMLLDFRHARHQGSLFLDILAPFAYLLMTALFNVFPLPQQSGFRESFAHAGRAMDRGYNVIVFPEGRRSDDGTAQPFKSGAGLLWKQLGCPAIAVFLSGLGELKAGGGRWFRSGRVAVRVGPVLPAPTAQSEVELTGLLENAVFNRQS